MSDAHCGLAHRRLRVIDLSPHAAQPMTNEEGSLIVVFNGEIYNFPSLRAELIALGHSFRSQSDTEVQLHGYESWGDALFAKLRACSRSPFGIATRAAWSSPAIPSARSRFSILPAAAR